MILRSNTPLALSRDPTAAGPEKVEMDTPGFWIPADTEVDDVTRVRFNGCASKRLVSMHVYLKDVEMFAEVGPDQNNLTRIERDDFFYTYTNRYLPAEASFDSKFMRNNGVRTITRRGLAKYHSISKQVVNARSNTHKNLTTLNVEGWKEYTHDADVYDKVGEATAVQPRTNIDWYLWLPLPLIFSGTSIVGFKGNVVCATKWRLYGTRP